MVHIRVPLFRETSTSAQSLLVQPIEAGTSDDHQEIAHPCSGTDDLIIRAVWKLRMVLHMI